MCGPDEPEMKGERVDKLKIAVQALRSLAEHSPPDDWNPTDDWGDYNEYDGTAKTSVEPAAATGNYGDVHSHGIDVGEWRAAKDAREALRQMGETWDGPDAPPASGYWFCPGCSVEVDSRNVTYEKVHDDCGMPVTFYPA